MRSDETGNYSHLWTSLKHWDPWSQPRWILLCTLVGENVYWLLLYPTHQRDEAGQRPRLRACRRPLRTRGAGATRRVDTHSPLQYSLSQDERWEIRRYGQHVFVQSANPHLCAVYRHRACICPGILMLKLHGIGNVGFSLQRCSGFENDGHVSIRRYDPALSSSARLLEGTQGVSVLGQSTQGNLVREDCALQKEDGTAWAYPNQTVVVANQSSPIFGGASGLLGLGTNALSGNFNETLFAGWLSRNPGRTNFSYGMQLQPLGADGSTEGGMLHWVVPDDSAFQGTMSVKDKLSVGPSDMNLDWVVNLDSFSISAGDLKISKTNERVAIDPFFPGIFLPQSVSRPLFAGIPGSSSQPSSSSPATTAYTVPCDTQVTLDVRFGEFSVTLREDVLVFKNGTTCTSAFEEWNDQGMSEFLFGATFISAVYLVFTISGSNDGSIGFGARAGQATKIHPAAIAGIVIGSVAIVAIIVFTAVLVLRSRRRRRDDSKQENKIEPFGNVTTQVDEQRGLLMPQTPTTAGTQGGFNITPVSSPNPSAYTTPFPSANTRQSFVTPLNAAPVAPSTANEIDLLAPPPPYSGSSTSSHTTEVQTIQLQSTVGSSSRPTSANSASQGYGFQQEKRRRLS